MLTPELKDRIDNACSYDLRWSDHAEEYDRVLHTPVYEAVLNNDSEVIAYLEGCHPDIRKRLFPAITDGIRYRKGIFEGVDRAMNLYKNICDERGFGYDEHL